MKAARPVIPLSRPLVGNREMEAVLRPLRSGWLTQGPEVQAFEREFAEFVGAPHACAVSSGSTALHLALHAVGVRPNDEVITVSHSFVATANSIRACGATPVFVDIEPATFNIDPTRIEAAITARTRAILCVHQLGLPCDLAAIGDVAARHSLRVVEDAACAVGSEVLHDGRWEHIGRPHGDVACFSFHPRKLLTTGEGGMLTTATAEWDRQFRMWRQHGMTVSDVDRHRASEVVFESYEEFGWNYRLSDVQAAIGREQLVRLPSMIARRRALANRYTRLLRAVPGVTPPAEPPDVQTNWQSYCVRLPDQVDQRHVMQFMLDAGIATRRAVMCAHREPAFTTGAWDCGGRTTCGCSAGTCDRLIESERAQDRALILPLFPQLDEADQDYIVESLAAAILDEADMHTASRAETVDVA